MRLRLTRLILVALVGWTAILTASLGWEIILMGEQASALARFEALAMFQRDLAYRAWNAQMGGVYASAAAITPNPYLDVPNRDLVTAIGPLTLVNPSYMTRVVHELAAVRTGIVSRITSLNPIRPANAPLPWEREVLESFETGVVEYAERAVGPDGASVMRFMRPLMVEKPCLQCHEKQGYVVGDIRGGISVTVPMAPIEAIQAPTIQFALAGHVGVWLLGLLGIGAGGRAMTRLVGQLEDAREAAQTARRRAEDSDQAKSRFLATMSHELRTPLNAILGFSDMMQRKVFGSLGDSHYEEYAQDIHTSGEHLLSLVNDVLDISKIAAGRMTLSESPVSLAGVVQTVAGLFSAQAAEHRIRLDLDLDSGMPPMRADARAVKQMLINLLANALHFTPDGKRILVTAKMDDAGQYVLAVSDSGPGIPAHELKAVLKPFYQVVDAGPMSRSTGPRDRSPAKGGGTGLGLALVKGFIELHGGSIRLSSALGQGTTVTLIFPADRAMEADPEADPDLFPYPSSS